MNWIETWLVIMTIWIVFNTIFIIAGVITVYVLGHGNSNKLVHRAANPFLAKGLSVGFLLFCLCASVWKSNWVRGHNASLLQGSAFVLCFFWSNLCRDWKGPPIFEMKIIDSHPRQPLFNNTVYYCWTGATERRCIHPVGKRLIFNPSTKSSGWSSCPTHLFSIASLHRSPPTNIEEPFLAPFRRPVAHDGASETVLGGAGRGGRKLANQSG